MLYRATHVKVVDTCAPPQKGSTVYETCAPSFLLRWRAVACSNTAQLALFAFGAVKKNYWINSWIQGRVDARFSVLWGGIRTTLVI